jgi:hypothetical protein
VSSWELAVKDSIGAKGEIREYMISDSSGKIPDSSVRNGEIENVKNLTSPWALLDRAPNKKANNILEPEGNEM